MEKKIHIQKMNEQFIRVSFDLPITYLQKVFTGKSERTEVKDALKATATGKTNEKEIIEEEEFL